MRALSFCAGRAAGSAAHHAASCPALDKAEGGGFVWKFDEKPVGSVGWEQVAEGELLKDIELPMDFIAGEFSEVVPPPLAQRIGRALRNGRGPIVIPSAYHHVPVDQPLALVAAMRALLI